MLIYCQHITDLIETLRESAAFVPNTKVFTDDSSNIISVDCGGRLLTFTDKAVWWDNLLPDYYMVDGLSELEGDLPQHWVDMALDLPLLGSTISAKLVTSLIYECMHTSSKALQHIKSLAEYRQRKCAMLLGPLDQCAHSRAH